MVQRTILVLEDDLDGGDAVETVSFALDGVSYDIDLNEANATQLRDALAPWVGHARRTGGRSRSGTAANAARGRGRSRLAWQAHQPGFARIRLVDFSRLDLHDAGFTGR